MSLKVSPMVVSKSSSAKESSYQKKPPPTSETLAYPATSVPEKSTSEVPSEAVPP